MWARGEGIERDFRAERRASVVLAHGRRDGERVLGRKLRFVRAGDFGGGHGRKRHELGRDVWRRSNRRRCAARRESRRGPDHVRVGRRDRGRRSGGGSAAPGGGGRRGGRGGPWW